MEAILLSLKQDLKLTGDLIWVTRWRSNLDGRGLRSFPKYQLEITDSNLISIF